MKFYETGGKVYETASRRSGWLTVFAPQHAREHNAHKGFTITPNVNYKCLRSVAAFALPVAAMALPQPPIYLSFT